MPHKLSVIIPCYQAEKTVARAIEHVFSQSLSQELYEVIVIDDGSTDGTADVLKRLQDTYPFVLITNPRNSGAARTRNTALQAVQHEIVVFIQDDIYIEQDFLKVHYDAHQAHPEEQAVIVGLTYWYEGLPRTPFLRYLDHSEQFDYERFSSLEPGSDGLIPADYLLFYTSNLSLKTSFIRSEGGFEESFVLPGSGIAVYEDTELAWRLHKRGMQMYFAPHARAGHDHVRDLDSIKKRKYAEGLFTHILHKKHPDFSWAGEKRSFLYNVSHLKLGALFDRYRLLLVIITSVIFNPVVVWPLEKIAQRVQYRWNVPFLNKIVLGYHYNRGYWKGVVGGQY